MSSFDFAQQQFKSSFSKQIAAALHARSPPSSTSSIEPPPLPQPLPLSANETYIRICMNDNEGLTLTSLKTLRKNMLPLCAWFVDGLILGCNCKNNNANEVITADPGADGSMLLQPHANNTQALKEGFAELAYYVFIGMPLELLKGSACDLNDMREFLGSFGESSSNDNSDKSVSLREGKDESEIEDAINKVTLSSTQQQQQQQISTEYDEIFASESDSSDFEYEGLTPSQIHSERLTHIHSNSNSNEDGDGDGDGHILKASTFYNTYSGYKEQGLEILTLQQCRTRLTMLLCMFNSEIIKGVSTARWEELKVMDGLIGLDGVIRSGGVFGGDGEELAERLASEVFPNLAYTLRDYALRPSCSNSSFLRFLTYVSSLLPITTPTSTTTTTTATSDRDIALLLTSSLCDSRAIVNNTQSRHCVHVFLYDNLEWVIGIVEDLRILAAPSTDLSNSNSNYVYNTNIVLNTQLSHALTLLNFMSKKPSIKKCKSLLTSGMIREYTLLAAKDTSIDSTMKLEAMRALFNLCAVNVDVAVFIIQVIYDKAEGFKFSNGAFFNVNVSKVYGLIWTLYFTSTKFKSSLSGGVGGGLYNSLCTKCSEFTSDVFDQWNTAFTSSPDNEDEIDVSNVIQWEQILNELAVFTDAGLDLDCDLIHCEALVRLNDFYKLLIKVNVKVKGKGKFNDGEKSDSKSTHSIDEDKEEDEDDVEKSKTIDENMRLYTKLQTVTVKLNDIKRNLKEIIFRCASGSGSGVSGGGGGGDSRKTD